ncbi:AraC family transcriptional regulator [Pseudomarimonas arenosa]|uniref:AraC family transcriptional regulator n=1 Tax=Pseudomarimonas arenosa TaxID=2774145 RepID=A0AAW3ZG46_9GAMM|nr:helix-turn-helix domain-containing protein [Pseudomarimonas arenosa]MBD8525043.1 AraC family transcriptional regulator [Pseudomarimonas arenosa]
MIKLIDILFAIGAAQALFFSLLLVFVAQRNRAANRWLSGFIGLWSLVLIDQFLYSTAFYRHTPYLVGWVWPVSAALTPCLYLYACSLMQIPQRRVVWHGVPVLAYFVLLVEFLALPGEQKLRLIYQPSSPGNSIWQIRWMSHVVLLQVLVYLPLIFLHLHRHQQRIREQFSAIDHLDLLWLRRVLFAFLTIFLVSLVGTFKAEWLQPSQLLMNALLVLTIFALGLLGARQTPIAPADAALAPQPPSPSAQAAPSAYRSSRFLPQLELSLRDHLLTLMAEHKPHHKSDLTLGELAKLADMSTHDLSQLLNCGLQTKFYDFVNQHRVDDAIDLLKAGTHLSMTDLAVEVGFNSRTTFYSAFKKRTGQTPNGFRKGLSQVAN